MARGVSIVRDTNIHVDLSSVTQIFFAVFDEIGDVFRITDFENDCRPMHSEDWLQLNQVPKGIIWVGSGIGDERTVRLFFFPREIRI